MVPLPDRPQHTSLSLSCKVRVAHVHSCPGVRRTGSFRRTCPKSALRCGESPWEERTPRRGGRRHRKEVDRWPESPSPGHCQPLCDRSGRADPQRRRKSRKYQTTRPTRTSDPRFTRRTSRLTVGFLPQVAGPRTTPGRPHRRLTLRRLPPPRHLSPPEGGTGNGAERIGGGWRWSPR